MSEDLLNAYRREAVEDTRTITRLRAENVELRAEVERLRAQIAGMEQTLRDDQAHRDFMAGVVGSGAG